MPEERMISPLPSTNTMSEAFKAVNLNNDSRKENVVMERSYLKGW
jgi:hypothetical protein